MKDLFKSLNLLFPTDDIIDDLINKLKTHQTIPKQFTEFMVCNNELVYKPLKLQVIKNENKQAFLTNIFKDNLNMVGKGIVTTYKYIQARYINITRNDIYNFLKQQPQHQLLVDKQIVKARPIYEKASNIRWQIDLIDMSFISGFNNKYNYILNCVDVYSRYGWLRLLRHKTAVNVRTAFIDIVNTANIAPTLCQSDNGT